jgi:pimeloyl-ACP methyl ester carboxylesterase
MAERAAELRAETGLSSHADAVVEVLREARAPVVLVGHSYAGLVVRQAADRVPQAVERIVLVDAWFGPDGCSLFDLAPAWFGAAIWDLAAAGEVPWSIPPPPAELVGVTDPDDRAWLEARLTPQPVASFTEPTRLTGAVEAVPTSAIVVEPSAFPFREMAEAAGYPTAILDAGHDAMVTHPGALADLLAGELP